jgi:hypothetical protein
MFPKVDSSTWQVEAQSTWGEFEELDAFHNTVYTKMINAQQKKAVERKTRLRNCRALAASESRTTDRGDESGRFDDEDEEFDEDLTQTGYQTGDSGGENHLGGDGEEEEEEDDFFL